MTNKPQKSTTITHEILERYNEIYAYDSNGITQNAQDNAL